MTQQMDNHTRRKLIACYYAWGHYDHGQRSLNFTRIEPQHVMRFGELYADAHARMLAGETVSVPGLSIAWESFTLSDGKSITREGK